MRKRDLERVAGASPDLVQERLDALRELMPEAFGEAGIDFDKLRTALGEFVDDSPERYLFSWSGKRDAIRAFQAPSRATLAPDRDHSVNFDDTANVFIEGENLEVLKLLHKSYFGRVKMIYIDPPYNTGNDFVYPDDYSDPLEQYLRVTGQKDADGNLLTSNPESGGRYHSAWLSMMYPRLFVARQLLRDDGLIFLSIDDNELHNLRMLMNEVFGEESFVATLIWKRRQNVDSRAKSGVSADHEYCLIYRKSADARIRGQEKDLTKYSNPDNDPRGPWSSDNLVGLATREQRPNLHYDLQDPETQIVYPCPPTGWRYHPPTMNRLITEGRILWPASASGRPRLKRFQNDLTDDFTGLSTILSTVHNTQATRELNDLFDGDSAMDFPKPSEYIKLLVQQGCPDAADDVVLDFFAGSCTTAHAVLQLNREDGGRRRFIMVQLPEPLQRPRVLDEYKAIDTIADFGRERISRVIHLLKSQKAGQLDVSTEGAFEDLGFRSYLLKESSYRPADPVGAADSTDASQLFIDPLQSGWTVESLLYETALREGFDLAVRVEQVPDATANTVYRLTDPYKEQSCLVCLDDTLAPETPRELGLTRDQLFICLDSALDNDLAANLALQCRLKVI